MKKTLLLIAAVVALAACTKVVEKEVPVEVEVEKIVDILTLNAAQLRVPNAAVEQPISFTTENAWTISSDVDWITFDKTSGAAGNNTLTMKVAANEGYSTRTGHVTLSSTHSASAARNTIFTVVQSETEVFNSTINLSISPDDQDVEVAYSSNLTPEVKIVEGDWLTVVRTKANPSDGKIVVHAAANESEEARTGKFTVAAGSNIQTYNVFQSSVAAPVVATGKFLANVQDMYDESSWSFKEFSQFVVTFPSEDGEVTLALNVANPVADATRIPAGEYTIDDAGTYAPGTFSTKSSNPAIKYYTTVVKDGAEMDVVEGTVFVSDNMGNYYIVAQLTDFAGATHVYSYQGEIEVEDASLGARVYTDSNYSRLVGQYNTYFTTKAFQTNVFLHINKPLPGNEDWIYGIQFNMYTETSDGNIPTGKFTYAVPETNTELGYSNGVKVANSGTFELASLYAFAQDPEHSASCNIKEGTTPTLEVIKQDDGRFTFNFTATVVISEYYYDDNYTLVTVSDKEIELNATLKDIYCESIADSGMAPIPDGDAVLVNGGMGTLQGQFFGDPLGTGSNIACLGWTGANSNSFYISLTFDLGPEFVFEPTIRDRYSVQLLPDGDYPYSDVVIEGQKAILPGRYGTSSRCYIKNLYSGTTFFITGGSMSFSNGNPTFDLTGVSAKGVTAHFTGTFPSTGVQSDGRYRGESYQANFNLYPYVAPTE